MFDVGFWELLIIAIVLLLVMGPERLPDVARQAAFLVRKARQGMYRLRNEMKGEIDGTPFADLRAAQQEMRDFKNDMKQFGHELADSVQETGKKVKDAADQIAAIDLELGDTETPDEKKVKGEGAEKIAKKAASNKATKKVVKKTTKKVAKKTSSKATPAKKTSGRVVKKAAKKTASKKKVVKKAAAKKTTARKTKKTL